VKRFGGSADIDAQIAALCHDVVEDTAHTYHDIEAALGLDFDSEAMQLIRLLTKTWGDREPASTVDARRINYYKNISQSYKASVLKVLDRVDNLEDMIKLMGTFPNASVVRWARRYVVKTERDVKPLLATCSLLYDRYCSAVNRTQKAVEIAELVT